MSQYVRSIFIKSHILPGARSEDSERKRPFASSLLFNDERARDGGASAFLDVAVFHSVAYQEALLAGSEGGPRNAISERVAIPPQVISEISIDRLRSRAVRRADNSRRKCRGNARARARSREGLIKKYLQPDVITRRARRVNERARARAKWKRKRKTGEIERRSREILSSLARAVRISSCFSLALLFSFSFSFLHSALFPFLSLSLFFSEFLHRGTARVAWRCGRRKQVETGRKSN